MPRSKKAVRRERSAGAAARPSRSAPAPAAAGTGKEGDARRAREDLWRQLFEQVPEPAFVTDAEGRLLITNPAAARLLESRECPLDGRPVADLVVQRDRPRVLDLLERLRSSRRAALETDLGLRRAGGRALATATSLVALRGDGGRLRAVGWLLRRIGQPRPLAERLQRTRQEASDLRFALDQSAALLGFDRRGRVNEANERCCRIFGKSREELIGCTVEDLGAGSDALARLSDIRRALRQGDVWGGELHVSRAENDGSWLHCTVVPLLDPSGVPSHFLAVLRDVTERRTATERLVEQEGLARLGAMAAVVAHEVRNPLAAARGALDVIGPRVSSPDDRRILADVSDRLAKLNDLVSDILLYARPRPLVLADTDLADLVEGAVREGRADPQGGSVHFTFERPSETVRLRLDVGALQRVILNLLRNAAQAMGGLGRVEVIIESDPARCRVRVRDRGPGIREEDRERIFEPFFTTKHKGSGLGLATARRTVELHGGRLRLFPAPGGGTDAVVDLPREASALPES